MVLPPRSRMQDYPTDSDDRQMARITFHGVAPEVATHEVEVTRISPSEMRLAFATSFPPSQGLFIHLHRTVDVVLPLPRPLREATTKGRVVGVAHNYRYGYPPIEIDVQFGELSPEEEQALRDSNPKLMVS